MENNQNKGGPKTPEGKAVSKLNALSMNFEPGSPNRR